MMNAAFLFVAATTPLGSFVRCGRKWLSDGTFIAVKDWSEEQLEELIREPNLQTRPATEEEAKAAKADAEPVISEADLTALNLRVDEAIRSLSAEDFTTAGQPKVGAVQTLLEADRARINKTVVGDVFGQMANDGFEVPEAS